MGNTFLIMLIFLVGGQKIYAQIVLDEPGVVVSPPIVSDEEQAKLQKKRFRETEERKKPLDPPTKTLAEKIKKEDVENRPKKIFMQVSLVYPFVSVKKPRTQYTVEPGFHFNFLIRHAEERKLEQFNLFYGFRIAPFAGTGIYEDVPIRYGLTHFGPSIGVGIFSEKPKLDRSKAETLIESQTKTRIDSRSGLLVLGGVSWQNRLIKKDLSNTSDTPEEIIANPGITIDGTGLWFEASYMNVLYGVWGIHALSGVQFGKGKTFFWIGAAFAPWY